MQLADRRILHDQNTAGQENSLLYIVSDEQDGLAVLLPLIEQPLLHSDAREKVERGKRFIEQQQFRAGQQRTRECRTLTHTAGKLLRALVAPAGQTNVLERFRHTLVHLRAGNAAANFHRQTQVFVHRAPRKQQVALRHVAAVAAPSVDALAVHQNFTALARQKLVGQAENRGFAAAGRPDD